MFAILIKNSKQLTGHISAKNSSGTVERASSQCTPRVGITTNAKATSRHAPNAQKHW